jgi:hypothetical protein
MPIMLPKPWRSEIQYLSAERKQTTGKSLIYDGDGNFVAAVPTQYAQLFSALPELLEVATVADAFWGDGICEAPIWPGAYLTAEDDPFAAVVRRAVKKATGK